MNFMRLALWRYETQRLRRTVSRWWYLQRHTEFHQVKTVPPPDGVTDATASIQAAIDDAQHSSEYEQALQRYEARRLRILHRKPVLRPMVQFSPGTFRVNMALDLPDGVKLRGNGFNTTIR